MSYRQGFNMINMTGTTTVAGINYLWYPQTVSNDNDKFIRVIKFSTNWIVRSEEESFYHDGISMVNWLLLRCFCKQWTVYGLFVKFPFLRVWVMVFNATFNNISVISWLSVLFVAGTRVPCKNHRPVASHWQTLSHNVSSTTRHERDANSQLYCW